MFSAQLSEHTSGCQQRLDVWLGPVCCNWRKVTYELWGAQCLRHACVQLPKLLELVGLGYTAWFVYRYLLFKVR